MTIRLDGYEGFVQRLTDLSTKDATSAGQSAVRAGAKSVLAAIKSAAPASNVPEGFTSKRHRKNGKSRDEVHHKIRDNLKITKIRTGNEHQVAVSVTSGKAYQATFVERGSIHNTPNAFMERGLNSAKDSALSEMAKALEKQLTKRGV